MKKLEAKIPKKAKTRGYKNGQEGSTGLPVLKTYKLFINGTFPRSESGRYYSVHNRKNGFSANISRASRKDLRDAVLAARTGFSFWNKKTAYNRGQILYRLAEMLEGRADQLILDMVNGGFGQKRAEAEVRMSVDRTVYYAGWCDKYQQIFSSVNPVSGPYFNFSVPEPMGIIGLLPSGKSGLLEMISILMPAIAGGNAVLALAPQDQAMVAISLAESIATSDFPAGVINIFTGFNDELTPHLFSHMEINAIAYSAVSGTSIKSNRELASMNVKRVADWTRNNWRSISGESPYLIMDLQEIKTTWHPIGN